MTPFDYQRPDDVDDAVHALDRTHLAYAGGTDLLPRIKLRIDQPTHLVDIKRTGLSDEIVDDGDTITFGALTTLDTPVMDVAILENHYADGPYGAKGLGELPMIAVAPAIANAVHDATGLRIRDLPMSRRRMLDTIANGASR